MKEAARRGSRNDVKDMVTSGSDVQVKGITKGRR